MVPYMLVGCSIVLHKRSKYVYLHKRHGGRIKNVVYWVKNVLLHNTTNVEKQQLVD